MIQKNSRPSHPTTCGKVERFQQTLKKWLCAQPAQPSHHRRAPGPPGGLRRRLQPPPPAPLAAAPGHPRRRSTPPCPRPSQARSPHPDTHDRVRHDTRRQSRLGHPAPRRPAAPHRHRANLRGNLRHPARPGPPHQGRQRRHRRTPPRAHPRPHPRLPAHRSTQRPHPDPEMNNSRTCNRRSGCRRCLETSQGGRCRIRTCVGIRRRIYSPFPLATRTTCRAHGPLVWASAQPRIAQHRRRN